MLQQPTDGDYVIATGETHSIREFLDPSSRSGGIGGRGYLKEPSVLSPTEVDILKGDAAKAKKNWVGLLALRFSGVTPPDGCRGPEDQA